MTQTTANHAETWTVFDANGNQVYKQTAEGWDGNSFDEEYQALEALYAASPDFPAGSIEYRETFSNVDNIYLTRKYDDIMLRPEGGTFEDEILLGRLEYERTCEADE